MKKIGILTFHNPLNYGAALQALALEYFIEKKDFNSEIIDYRNYYISIDTSIKRIWKVKDNKRKLYYIIELPFWLIRKIKFLSFLKNVNMSSRCENISSEIYSHIVVGSDQVWNLEITKNDYTYFLEDVVGLRKVSYSSSFGNDYISSEERQRIKKNLECFSHIAVRETSGRNIVDEMFGRKVAKLVVDPTLLLKKNEWEYFAKNPKYNKKYILVYQLEYSETLIKFVKNISENTGYDVVTINGNPRQPLKAKYVLSAGPAEWLGWIKNAEIVITNSFHGSVFSIIFEKTFYTFLLEKQVNRNDRIITLMKSLGLESRIMNKSTIEKITSIDYKKVNSKKERLINISKGFLLGALKDEH